MIGLFHELFSKYSRSVGQQTSDFIDKPGGKLTLFYETILRQQIIWFVIICLLAISILIVGCGPNEQELAAKLATSVASTVTAIPTATSYPTATPFPTLTPYPTSTRYPTSTPFSTLTPYPTYTPSPLTPTPSATPTVGDIVVGPFWQVQIQKVEQSQEFGDYSPTNENAEFIIVTASVTYLGAEGSSGQYSPEGVVLTLLGPSDTGWSQQATLYRGENSSFLIDFDEASMMSYFAPGETRIETFAFIFLKESTLFQFYFPETPAITIDLDAIDA